MASKFRNLIVAKLRKQLNGRPVKTASIRLKKDNFALTIPAPTNALVEDFETDHYIPSVTSDGTIWTFHLPQKEFTREVLKEGLRRDYATYHWARNGLFPADEKRQKVIVEFSSPNIAKPFHMGHLRSTIIGNFVANIQAAVGHQVIKINWLGDWGTQFGLLAKGLQTKKNLEQILTHADPLQELYKVYVEVNQMASEDPLVASEARDLFAQLEAGNEQLHQDWLAIRATTVESLKKVYAKLGIQFDYYHGEAMYGDAKTKSEVISKLEKAHLLSTLEDARQVIDLDAKRRVVVTKSDGSSLYISRDIAAALHRLQSFQPAKMFYVVEHGQSNHFINLFEIVSKVEATDCQFVHVMFGRIQGMSTRKGTAVMLSDILQEAKERMLEKMEATMTTKVQEPGEKEEVAEILGISALLINDLKQKKTQNYKFSWNDALKTTGNSGIRLQYSHSRLHSLINENSIYEIQDWAHLNFELLCEPEAAQLILRLAQFEEALAETYRDLQPSILVRYLFALCDDTSKAIKVLQVKDSPEEIAALRLALFQVAKNVLSYGMSILGLTPLNKM